MAWLPLDFYRPDDLETMIRSAVDGSGELNAALRKPARNSEIIDAKRAAAQQSCQTVLAAGWSLTESRRQCTLGSLPSTTFGWRSEWTLEIGLRGRSACRGNTRWAAHFNVYQWPTVLQESFSCWC